MRRHLARNARPVAGAGLINTTRLGCLILTAVVLGGLVGETRAQHRTTNVPPTLEIEVLDPNADPVGNPAVELSRDEFGNVIVDIPPVILVHRYYFTGERSFQAQLLPGGPSIVVVNHPKTGERQYIDVQMPPGAPRVTYTDHGIDYDYGATGVSVVFGLFGHPSVKYRSGLALQTKVNNFFHVDALKQHAEKSHAHLKQSAGKTKLVAYGAAAKVGDTVEQVIMPAKNLLQILPFGKIIFDPSRGEKLMQAATEHKREKEMHRVEKQRRYEEMTRRTNR